MSSEPYRIGSPSSPTYARVCAVLVVELLPVRELLADEVERDERARIEARREPRRGRAHRGLGQVRHDAFPDHERRLGRAKPVAASRSIGSSRSKLHVT